MRGKHNHPVAEPLDMAFFVPTENFTGPDSASGGMMAEGPQMRVLAGAGSGDGGGSWLPGTGSTGKDLVLCRKALLTKYTKSTIL